MKKTTTFIARVLGGTEDGMKGEVALFLSHFVAISFNEKGFHVTHARAQSATPGLPPTRQIKWRTSIPVHCEHVGVVLEN